MTLRGVVLLVTLVVPTGLLLVLGPRQARDYPDDRIIVRYWEKWTGVEGAAMQRIVDRFNRTAGAADGIWVDYNAVSNVEQRMLVATAGGDPPDVAGLFDHVIAQFAEQGALLPLDDRAARHGIRQDAFKPTWWSIGVYDDTLYALPSAPYTMALLYNKRLFREAGLDPDHPPETIAEFSACARRLTRRDEEGRLIQIGFSPAPAMLGWWHWVWPNFFDGRLWDGRRFMLDAPAGRAAMQWIADEQSALGHADALAFEAWVGAIEGAQNPFLAEKLAMLLQGPWVANWVATYAPQLEYGVARFPSVTREQRNVFVSCDVFVIPNGARHPDAAMRFLAYVLQQEVMEELCKAHWKVSPYRTVGAAFYETHPNPHIRTFDELASGEHTFGHPKMPTFQQASREMLFMLENVLQDVRPPDKAVQRTQRKVDTIVNQYDRMQARRRAEGTTP